MPVWLSRALQFTLLYHSVYEYIFSSHIFKRNVEMKIFNNTQGRPFCLLLATDLGLGKNNADYSVTIGF